MNWIRMLCIASVYLQAFGMLLAFSGCAPLSLSTQSDAGVEGVWIREEDDYQGWVIEIREVEPGEYEARSLWVPNVARELYSFQIGEKKLRQMIRRSDGNYSLESLHRQEDATPSYSLSEATLSTDDRMILLADNPQGSFGERQAWRRVGRYDLENAYADYGRGKIAANRELLVEASAAYKRSAERLLKEKDFSRHHDLANSLAWQLAVNRHDELRNPQLALRLVPALGTWYFHVDTAAAVYAANGNFVKAIELQEKALTEIESEDAVKIYLRNNDLDETDYWTQIAFDRIVSRNKTQFAARRDLYEGKQIYRE